jgi:hypothetical protein
MYFLQAFSPPITIVVGDVLIEIPRFTVRDFAAWAEDLRQRMIEDATSKLDEEKRVEYLAFYPISPPTRQELRREASTDQGMERIVRTCLSRGNYFAVKMVKRTKRKPDGTIVMVKDKSGREVPDTYDQPTKGDPIPKKNDDWIEQLVLNNTGRMAHLAVELADMNDVSMAVPARIAKAEQNEEEKEEGEQDPLSRDEKGGGTP